MTKYHPKSRKIATQPGKPHVRTSKPVRSPSKTRNGIVFHKRGTRGGEVPEVYANEDGQHQFEWEPSPEDRTNKPPLINLSKRSMRHYKPRFSVKRSKEEKNRKLYDNWNLVVEDLVKKTWTQRGHAASGMFDPVEVSLKAEFEARLQREMNTCPNCTSTQDFTKLPGSTMSVVDVVGHFSVEWPHSKCNTCNHTWCPHPVEVGTFPATPLKPQTVYTDRLMSLTTNVKFEGHISLHAWSHALHNFHRGQMQEEVLGFSQLWDNRGDSWERWRAVQKCATDLTGLGVEPIVAGWLRCAACVKTIRGAMSDACMGVTRLWKAAKSQYFRTPTQDANSIFVDEGFMRGLLVQREKADAKLLEKVECNNHLAANVQGRKSDMYDVQGIAATICRHEQV